MNRPEQSRPPRPMKGPGSQMGGEKAKDFKNTLKKLLNYANKQRKYMIIATIMAVLGSVLTLVGPSNISTLTDTITAGIQSGSVDLDSIFSLGVFVAVLYGLSYLFSIAQGMVMATAVQTVAKRLRTNICEKINALPMGYFSKTSKGDVLSRVTNDVDTVGLTLSQSGGMLVSSITLLVGSVLVMALTNVVLTLTAMLSAVIGFAFMGAVMGKSQGFFRAQQQHLGAINGHIEEMFSGHTVVKAYNGEQASIDTFNGINQNLRGAAFRAQALSGLMMPVMTFVGNFGYVCVCVVGALLALNGAISFGVIVAFMLYIRLFTQPLGQIAQGVQNLQSGMAAAERVFSFLEEAEMPDESHKPAHHEKVQGNVEFDHVSFGYNPDKIIIKDFSASVKAGQKIAIVGPTGAGKTTMVNLLMRFYDVNNGDIRMDGVSINDMNREDVHAKFSMVLQDTWLFEGTLRENLVYTKENVSKEELDRACRAVGLRHFVKTLPHGYDTVLNDNLQLSQGQKQQITIARAMIADKSMIILDEATSSIDTRTELQIQKAMDELMENRTSFVIAHRLSTIKNADLILVMKDGDVIEKGTHAGLLAEHGFYAELYNAQFDQ